MRRLLLVLVLVAFCTTFIIPSKAEAGDTSNILQGAAIGAVVGGVIGWYIWKSSKDNQSSNSIPSINNGNIHASQDSSLLLLKKNSTPPVQQAQFQLAFRF